MKLFNRMSRCIRTQSRKRPPVRLSFDLFEERLLLAPFTVNSNLDTNTGTGNTGTLRYVITQLDASTDATNTIDFQIGPVGTLTTITLDPLNPDLPAITKQVTINGYSQGGTPNTESDGSTNAVILIQLNLNNHLGLVFNGGATGSAGSTVGGLSIFGGSAAAIDINANNVTVAGNFLGIQADGTTVAANVTGVNVAAGVTGAQIGSAALADRNLISGNTGDGIDISSDGNFVQGNLIGTNAAGTAANGNDGAGIHVQGANNIIGGTTAADRNIISGNKGLPLSPVHSAGVFITGSGATSNVVEGNYIGTDKNGGYALPNVGDGIEISGGAGGNMIGGSTPGAGNLISGNKETSTGFVGDGVLIAGTGGGNTVQGNNIGTNATGTALVPNTNTGAGVAIQGTSSGNLIGGTATGEANTLAFNGFYGIYVSSTGNHNTFRWNQIFANGSGGITLTSTSSNDGQLPPILTASTSFPGHTAIEGVIQGHAGDTYDLDIFTNHAPNNQAQTLFTTQTLVIGAGGTTNFSFDIPVGVSVGTTILTAEATDVQMGSSFQGDSSGLSSPITVSSAFVVTNVNDSGIGSLRQAILNADQEAGQTIRFDISGMGVHTIAPTSALPTITDPVIIDGTTQPGYTGTPLIELDGAGAGSSSDGLTITAGSSTVRGLVINRFSGDGIEITGSGASNNVISGNFIGTNAAGTAALGNQFYGIFVSNSPSNTIGGTTAAARNVISGNRQAGIWIYGALSTGNLVQGNFIGTDLTGTAKLGNSGDGVLIQQGPVGNTIGGTTAAARNVISGNGGSGPGGFGVSIGLATSNVVQGNFIGTDVTGAKALGNVHGGVIVQDAASSTIGGATASARNIISGNTGNGITIDGPTATANLLQGNFIGTDVTGTLARGNSGNGVQISSGATNNTIGGTVGGAGNLIAANNANGIYITGSGTSANPVLGNFIGTNASGATNLGNGAGVAIDNSASNNTIGGTGAGAGNVISGNSVDGIDISSDGNLVQGNKIGTNAAGTAALGNTFDGINLNDASSNRIIGNVVSGNGINNGNQDAAGINLESNDQFNIIAGNEIGTNAAGDAMLGNSLHGIFLGNGSSNNTIGGTTVNDRNVISGNGKFPVADFATQGGVGVYIFGANTSSNVVQGNYIGTNAAGTAALTNSVIGVLINQSSGNTVQGNLISGNRSVGVEIAGSTATGNQVQGNMIGTDAGGTRAIPNGLDGIFINGAPHNTIGGTAAGAGNLISANLSAGIQIYGAGATNNQIFRNRIGLDANGRPTLPNGTKPLVTGIFSQISIQKNDFGFSTVNRNLGQVLPWQSPASIGGGTVSGDSQAAVAAQRKASLAGSVSGRHRALSKRKTVIVTAVHSYPNAKLALGLSRKSPA